MLLAYVEGEGGGGGGGCNMARKALFKSELKLDTILHLEFKVSSL